MSAMKSAIKDDTKSRYEKQIHGLVLSTFTTYLTNFIFLILCLLVCNLAADDNR